jgi:hypothetical protein
MYYTINLLLHVFGAAAILRKITPILLQRTAIRYFYNDQAYQCAR